MTSAIKLVVGGTGTVTPLTPGPDQMSHDQIPPAVSAEVWASIHRGKAWKVLLDKTEDAFNKGDTAALIALSNAQLPDSDPRKITRDIVDLVRSAAYDATGLGNTDLDLMRFADALESYLPPR